MVENTALNEADALARRHPIAAFSLDALTAGAAKLRPDRIALAEAVPGQPAREISYGEFDRQVRALAQHIGELGLAPGERLLILTSPCMACVNRADRRTRCGARAAARADWFRACGTCGDRCRGELHSDHRRQFLR
jgi:acyl-CoA synthetase (AMP-forming)/AMP-acid ligase II